MIAAAAPGYENVYTYPPPPPPSAARPSRPRVIDDELRRQLRLIQQMEEDEALARALQDVEGRNPEETRRVQQHNEEKKRQEQLDEEEARRLQYWYDVEEPQREAERLYASSRIAAEERQRQVENDEAYARRLAQGLLG